MVLNALSVDVEEYFHAAIFRTATKANRSEEHTSELQSQSNLVCRLLLEKQNDPYTSHSNISIRPSFTRRPQRLSLSRHTTYDLADDFTTLSICWLLSLPFTTHPRPSSDP